MVLLGGGNSNIFGIFTPKIGEDEPILTNIFQGGWNHQPVLESRNFWEVTEKGWLKRWWVGSLSIGGICIGFLKCFRFPHIEAIENTFRTFRDFQTSNYYFNLPSEDFFATTKEWIIENPMASIQFFSCTIFDEMKGECSNQCLFQWHQAAWILSLISLPPNPILTKCEYLHILRMSFSSNIWNGMRYAHKLVGWFSVRKVMVFITCS